MSCFDIYITRKRFLISLLELLILFLRGPDLLCCANTSRENTQNRENNAGNQDWNPTKQFPLMKLRMVSVNLSKYIIKWTFMRLFSCSIFCFFKRIRFLNETLYDCSVSANKYAKCSFSLREYFYSWLLILIS